MKNQKRCAYQSHRSGSILLIVLVTVSILALSVLSFSSLMLVEERAARVQTRQFQSRHLVDSGMEYTRLFLSRPESEIVEAGRLWDNQDSFRGIAAVADANDPGRKSEIGRFTLVAPNMNDDGVIEGTRYGLVNESSKININVLPFYDTYGAAAFGEVDVARNLLLALPDMTEEIADAIIDFVDSDDEEKESGAESSFYNGLTPPYNAKNGPLDSIDELLLVRGVTTELLFGLDTNRNGVLDDSEAALGNVSQADAESVLGWANYLTLYSKESNLTPEGLPKININADDLDQLYDDLRSVFSDDWANFIIMHRLGSANGLQDLAEIAEGENDEGAEDGGPPAEIELPDQADLPDDLPEDEEELADLADDEGVARVMASQVPFEIPESPTVSVENKFRSVLDMLDTSFPSVDADGNSVIVESPLRSTPPGNGSLIIALQSLTVYEGNSVPGRINIRQAPRVIIEGLPVFRDDPDLVEEFMANREVDLDDPAFLDRGRKHPTFLLEESFLGDVSLIPNPEANQRMQQLMPFICADGDVYRAEILGYFGDGRGTSRAEVVFDTTVPTGIPRVLMWRDKSHLQTGYSIEALGSELEAIGERLER